MRTSVTRALFVSAGLLFFAIGTLGVFLPLLPSVPFYLLAAACLARGDRRLHAWMLARPGVGPALAAWERDGAIPPRAKRVATGMILLSFSFPLFVVPGLPLAARLAAAVTAIAVLSFIWTRPDGRPASLEPERDRAQKIASRSPESTSLDPSASSTGPGR